MAPYRTARRIIFVMSRRWSFFYAKNGVRVTVRVTFRVTNLGLQKRNVVESVTVRVTLLTLLKADKMGKRHKKRQKTAFFIVFEG